MGKVLEKMKQYFIEDDKGLFWCEHHIGYWSNFNDSLKYRFEGLYLLVYPLCLLMRLHKIKCQIKEVKSNG